MQFTASLTGGGAVAATRNVVIVSGVTGTFDTNGNNVTFGGALSLGSSGTLVKTDTTGAGTLEIDGTNSLGSYSSLQVNSGTLRLKATSGASTVGAGITATVASGATLQLAGSVSALSQPTNVGVNAANVVNNSTASAGGLLVTGTNQQVGRITGTGNVVVATNASLTATQIRQNSLTIDNGGAVTLLPSGVGAVNNPSGVNNLDYSGSLTSLSIANNNSHPGALGNTYFGTLDIGNSGLVIAYGGNADPFVQIEDMVRSGYNNGVWTGTGIISSLARASVTTSKPLNIGLIDFVPNGPGFGSSILFEGQVVTTSAVLVRLTYMDDLVLAGDMLQANATSDALFFAANYGSGTTWHVGDVTHDGVIDTNDALYFAANYVVGLPSLDGGTSNPVVIGGPPVQVGGNVGAGGAVPEPSSILLTIVAAFGLSVIARRRTTTR